MWKQIIWVKSKLLQQIAHLKWGQMRRKPIKIKKKKKKINKRNKNKEESVIYSPTSTPITWSSDLYVQELMKVKTRLEIVEAIEQERDRKISEITVANQCLMEGNRILKEQVTMLQEALETGKQEWKNMKEVITTKRDVIISKQTQVDTGISTNRHFQREEKNEQWER